MFNFSYDMWWREHKTTHLSYNDVCWCKNHKNASWCFKTTMICDGESTKLLGFGRKLNSYGKQDFGRLIRNYHLNTQSPLSSETTYNNTVVTLIQNINRGAFGIIYIYFSLLYAYQFHEELWSILNKRVITIWTNYY